MSPLPEPPVGLEQDCDVIMSDIAAQMALFQPVYLAVHGRYWQGQATHAVLPSDGDATSPDTSRRVDDCGSWADQGIILPSMMPLAVRLDSYDGPSGCGYVVVGQVEIAGGIWQRSIGVGPESRSHNWLDVTPESVP